MALDSALPPLGVAAKRLRFTPNSSKAKSQLLADIALKGAVSCSTDVAAAAPAKPPGVHMSVVVSSSNVCARTLLRSICITCLVCSMFVFVCSSSPAVELFILSLYSILFLVEMS